MVHDSVRKTKTTGRNLRDTCSIRRKGQCTRELPSNPPRSASWTERWWITRSRGESWYFWSLCRWVRNTLAGRWVGGQMHKPSLCPCLEVLSSLHTSLYYQMFPESRSSKTWAKSPFFQPFFLLPCSAWHGKVLSTTGVTLSKLGLNFPISTMGIVLTS